MVITRLPATKNSGAMRSVAKRALRFAFCETSRSLYVTLQERSSPIFWNWLPETGGSRYFFSHCSGFCLSIPFQIWKWRDELFPSVSRVPILSPVLSFWPLLTVTFDSLQ